MLFRFDEIDRAFDWMGDLHRQLDRVLGQAGLTDLPKADAGGALAVKETEADLWLRADLPGVTADDVEINLEGDVLTLSAKRAIEVPAEQRVHMQERRGFEFTRSLKLPARVDPERVNARFSDGVLTIRLAKVAHAAPRQITVNAR